MIDKHGKLKGIKTMKKNIKRILKFVLGRLYRWLMKDKVWWRKFLSVAAPVYASKRLYEKALGKKLNLKNPQTLNEKCMWLKLNTYYRHPLITECCDKYRVCDYVKRMGCAEILNDLIGVWDNPDKIDFDKLPNQFVLKCNHGAGFNIICRDKTKLDISKTKKQLKKWLKEDYWKLYAETQYKFIKKKIICEKFLNAGQENIPVDYKLYMINGNFHAIMICLDRDKDVKFYHFDNNLRYRPDYNSPTLSVLPTHLTLIPSEINKMIDYAKILSKPFPFVRVDLYGINGKIIFSELTFLVYGGVFYTRYANLPSDIKFTSIPKEYLLTK